MDRLRERGGAFYELPPSVCGVGERAFAWEMAWSFALESFWTADIEVGSFVCPELRGFSAGHDCRIGAFATISGHVDLTSPARMWVMGVFVGSHAVLTPGVRVGGGGACLARVPSLSTRCVRARPFRFGNPARPVRQV